MRFKPEKTFAKIHDFKAIRKLIAKEFHKVYLMHS